MSGLSDLLRSKRPFDLPRMRGEPVAVRRSAQRIYDRWPDVEVEVANTDPESLVEEMERRRRAGDWREFYWADVNRATLALIDSGMWREDRFSDLLDFLLDQVSPSVNRPFVRTLFRKYLDTFDPGTKLTRDLARVLKESWVHMDLPIGSLVHRFRIFELEMSPARAIAAFMDHQEEPFRALLGAGMETPHGPGLMAAAHRYFVSGLAPRIESGDEGAARKLLDWIEPTSEGHPFQGPDAARAVETLLVPWRTVDPGPPMRELIESRLVNAYGDPRVRSAGVWATVSDDAREVILRWLAAATMEVFFEIISQAVFSHMWSDRKDLWLDLYEEGRIRQAWFALSKQGVAIAQRMMRKRGNIDLGFAENRSWGAEDRKKCLLIMNIDGKWVVEGSDNFKTHVFPRRKPSAWKPYEDSYTCEQFRGIKGREEPARIVHSPYSWRNRVMAALQK